MAKFDIGDTAYVPCRHVPQLQDMGVALYRTEILEVERSRARIQLRDGAASDWLGVSLLHRDVGILVLNVGDFASEASFLDPLAKSVGQFCRLLVPDDQLRQIRVRSLAELQTVWQQEQAAYTHVVWIGHGRNNAVRFAVDGWVSPAQLDTALAVRGAPRKTYISLACQTGYGGFGRPMSQTTICREFIAPFHSVDGAVASQFLQSLFTSHFLEGRTITVAFKEARKAVPGKSSFRLWRGGILKAGPR